MSLFKSIGKVLGKVAKPVGTLAGAYLGGPSGAALGGQIGSAFSTSRPGMGFVASSAGMSSLPPLIRGATTAGGYIVRGARAAAASASYYCRKYPTWCSTIGGLAAVEAMVGNGQLPPIKRRRRKGITPRDLSSFRRVASLIKSYGPTARKVPSSCAPRKTCKR